jgi:hypothetical protein
LFLFLWILEIIKGRDVNFIHLEWYRNGILGKSDQRPRNEKYLWIYIVQYTVCTVCVYIRVHIFAYTVCTFNKPVTLPSNMSIYALGNIL